jgi:hypothetical protein
MNLLTNVDFWLSVLAGLLTAAILSPIGYLVGRANRDKFYRRKFDKAAERFIEELSKQIQVSVEQGPEHALTNAISIISIRNEITRNLTILHLDFNSELTKIADSIAVHDDVDLYHALERSIVSKIPQQSTIEDIVIGRKHIPLVAEREEKSEEVPSEDLQIRETLLNEFNEKLYHNICILEKTWPIKKRRIKSDIKRMMSELGFDE